MKEKILAIAGVSILALVIWRDKKAREEKAEKITKEIWENHTHCGCVEYDRDDIPEYCFDDGTEYIEVEKAAEIVYKYLKPKRLE